MVFRLYRGFLAIAAFGIVSLTITFRSHQELHEQVRDQSTPFRRQVFSDSAHNGIPRSGSESSGSSTALYLQGKNRASTLSNESNATLAESFENRSSSNIYGHHALDETPHYPLVHIVYTRFMQHQPNLTALGLARLELLKDFFCGSLQGQTTDNFLVVIRTDPNLDERIKRPLLEIFPDTTNTAAERPRFRYLLIGTNDNSNSYEYDGLWNLLNGDTTSIWSGAIDESLDYLSITDNRPPLILETRLDSDDGLNREYLATLQRQARATLVTKAIEGDKRSTRVKPRTEPYRSWKMWCAGAYLEWQYTAPWELQKAQKKRKLKVTPGEDGEKRNNAKDAVLNNGGDEDFVGGGSGGDLGGLVSLRFSSCISAGLSIAYFHSSLDKFSTKIPLLQKHERLASIVRHCRRQKDENVAIEVDCLSFMKLNPSAIRARTPTSAGMLNILWDWDTSGTKAASNNSSHRADSQVKPSGLYQKYQEGAIKQKQYQEKLWQVVEVVFGLVRSRVREIRSHFRENIMAIAKENLEGQCSAGHSCKNSSQLMLRSIVEREDSNV